jgi:hypothetical protein
MNDHISGEDLAAYVDGLLAADKKNALESHFSSCPDCQDELAEITAVMSRREKIPVGILKLALGGGNKGNKSVLHLRLVFEVAAAFAVVVFIGYMFLDNNRFWQTPEQKKSSVVTDKNISLAEPAVSLRDREIAPLPAQRRGRTDALKTKSDLSETDAAQAPADPAVPDKRKNAVTEKGLAAGGGQSPVIPAPGNKLQERTEQQRQLTDEKENALKKEFARTATAVAATPSPVRVEGEAGLSDLRNPELLSAWSWLQKDQVLELQIDSAGTVTAAVALGKFEPLLARQAENEAKKLLFSFSEKKLRRARLVANEKPFN